MQCNKYNTFVKHCDCGHKILSLKEACNRLNCTEEHLSCGNNKKRLPCTLETCKTRRKFHFYKKTPLNEGTST